MWCVSCVGLARCSCYMEKGWFIDQNSVVIWPWKHSTILLHYILTMGKCIFKVTTITKGTRQETVGTHQCVTVLESSSLLRVCVGYHSQQQDSEWGARLHFLLEFCCQYLPNADKNPKLFLREHKSQDNLSGHRLWATNTTRISFSF